MKIIIAIILSLLLSGTSEACNRCGVFGRGCRLQANHVVAPVAFQVAQPTVVITNVYPQPLVSPVAQQGSTLYGLSSTVTPYNLDTQATLNLSARLAESSLDLARQANTNVTVLATHDIETKKILAAGIANAQAIQAAGVSIQTTISNGAVSVEQQEITQGSPLQVLESLSQKYCTRCHGGPTPKADLDLSNLASYSVGDIDEISMHLTSNDPSQLMPRGKDGKGFVLPYADLSAWLCSVKSLKSEEVDPNPVR